MECFHDCFFPRMAWQIGERASAERWLACLLNPNARVEGPRTANRRSRHGHQVMIFAIELICVMVLGYLALDRPSDGYLFAHGLPSTMSLPHNV
jgi:hypothetical protein